MKPLEVKVPYENSRGRRQGEECGAQGNTAQGECLGSTLAPCREGETCAANTIKAWRTRVGRMGVEWDKPQQKWKFHKYRSLGEKGGLVRRTRKRTWP